MLLPLLRVKLEVLVIMYTCLLYMYAMHTRTTSLPCRKTKWLFVCFRIKIVCLTTCTLMSINRARSMQSISYLRCIYGWLIKFDFTFAFPRDSHRIGLHGSTGMPLINRKIGISKDWCGEHTNANKSFCILCPRIYK